MKTAPHLQLALINAVGFSASTVMPLWLGGIAQQFGMPATFASQAVLAQLGGAALLNLLTSRLFRNVAPLTLSRGALLIAALAYGFAMTTSPQVFLGACLMCGAALGVLLNVTNRLMGSTDHVQRGYSIFVLVEVCCATLLFLGGAALIERHGLLTLFPAISVIALAAAVLIRLPMAGTLTTTPSLPDSSPSGALLALAALAMFFVGQSALNSFLPTLGQAAGLSAARASQFVGLGMPFGFAGAMLARVLGERLRPLIAVTMVTVTLACLASALASAPSLTVFTAVVVTLALSTMFCLPYFFAQLATFDRSGRYTAFGPAMMLTGIAIGPSTAVLLNASFGLASIGALSAALLAASAVCFALSARAAQSPLRVSMGRNSS